jgi:hypothetical protein
MLYLYKKEKNMIKKIAAAVIGIIVAGGIVFAVESLGHTVYPLPPDLDMSDPVQFGNYVESLPMGAFLFVAGAWVLGTLGGGLLACFIAGEKPRVYSTIVGGFILVATIANLIMIPHPLWFSISSLIAIAVMTYVTGSIATSFTTSDVND